MLYMSIPAVITNHLRLFLTPNAPFLYDMRKGNYGGFMRVEKMRFCVEENKEEWEFKLVHGPKCVFGEYPQTAEIDWSHEVVLIQDGSAGCATFTLIIYKSASSGEMEMKCIPYDDGEE